ncbi:MAG: hypothetical protein M1812_000479 [Candelaria pacifica]|nr:MAG: hypothetical protein M1812_000479 [Candelaria pacifica]
MGPCKEAIIDSPLSHSAPKISIKCSQVSKNWGHAGSYASGVHSPSHLPIRKRTEHAQSFPFLELPSEIRNTIYEMLFSTENDTRYIDDMGRLQYSQYLKLPDRFRTSYRPKARVWPSHGYPYPETTYTLRSQERMHLAILRVNRQASREALGYFYAQRFSFASTAMVVPFLKDRSAGARAFIKTLAVREIIKGNIDSLLWSKPQRSQFSQDWEQMCAYLVNNLNLEVFKLELGSHCKELTDTSADWIQQLAAIKGLKELQVSFTVFCRLRRHHNPPGGPCYSNHKEIAVRLRTFLQSQMLETGVLQLEEINVLASHARLLAPVTEVGLAADTRAYFYETYTRQQIDSPNS